jgi:hypothetical protein
MGHILAVDFYKSTRTNKILPRMHTDGEDFQKIRRSSEPSFEAVIKADGPGCRPSYPGIIYHHSSILIKVPMSLPWI